MKNQRFLLFLLFLFVALSALQNLGNNGQSALSQNDVGVMTDRNEYATGKTITLTVQNNTAETLVLTDDCGDIPFAVMRYDNGEWVNHSSTLETDCETPDQRIELPAGEKQSFTYKDWAYRLFGEEGRYRIDIALETESGDQNTHLSNEFTLKTRGLFGTLWMQGIYRPILNTLIFLIETVPGHSLGLAIIALTLIVRTFLLIPSQRAMRSQKKMQAIQPKLEELKKKYKDNQEMLAMETMKLWQSHKVNPFGSCLMLLVQFPIMIALYLVVQSGLSLDKVSLLYPVVGKNFEFASIQTNFLGILELTEIDFFILPLLVGGLQYVQMSLSMARSKKKKEAKEKKKDLTKVVEDQKDMQNEMQMAMNMMKYIMPAMIAFFTASLPAGVGLYWGVSTCYGIAQQIVINKEHPEEKDPNEPTVRVIEKT